MVFTLSPDSRATLTKFTSNPLEAAEALFGVTAECADCVPEDCPCLPHAGRISARTFSSESTNAERLSDRRNVRREENKRDTFPHWAC
jgi:hypothetical protein